MCVCVHACMCVSACMYVRACMHAPTSGSKPFGLAFNVSDSKAFIQSVISSSVSHYTHTHTIQRKSGSDTVYGSDTGNGSEAENGSNYILC